VERASTYIDRQNIEAGAGESANRRKNAKSDADKTAAKEEVQTARRNHQAALDKIRQETAAALAALGQ
jgi:hypothetical protein